MRPMPAISPPTWACSLQSSPGIRAMLKRTFLWTITATLTATACSVSAPRGSADGGIRDGQGGSTNQSGTGTAGAGTGGFGGAGAGAGGLPANDGGVPADGGGADGSVCTLAAGQWVAMPTAGAPTPAALRVEVWTGRELLIWTSNVLSWAGGGRFDVCTNRWTPATVSGAPIQIATNRPVPIVVGRRVFFFFVGKLGDSSPASSDQAAVVYDIDADRWQLLPLPGAPPPRAYAVQIAVGNQILIGEARRSPARWPQRRTTGRCWTRRRSPGNPCP